MSDFNFPSPLSSIALKVVSHIALRFPTSLHFLRILYTPHVMVPVSLRPQLRPLLTGDDAVVAVAPDAAEFGARRSSKFVGDWNSLREI